MPRVAVVDNYDSFTYNLVQYLQELGAECDVRLNDRTTLAELDAGNFDGIVISPGPGTPDAAGISLNVIRRLAGRLPILGVCLGHQAIGQAYGAKVVQAERLMHGKTSRIFHDGRGIFRGLPQRFQATRYHSLIVDPEELPECLAVTAHTEQGEIMALSHRHFPITGVQFHPESILTEHGLTIMKNWLELA